jgi:hypothetical protein
MVTVFIGFPLRFIGRVHVRRGAEAEYAWDGPLFRLANNSRALDALRLTP